MLQSVTELVNFIFPKDSREGEDSNEDCRPDSLIAAGRISQGSFYQSVLFLEFIIDSLIYKALIHEDGNLDEEEGNMDPSDGENQNDLEESSKPEVNSPSMIKAI